MSGLVALMLLSGCAYKVRVETEPPGAMVEGPRGQTVVSPGKLRLRPAPAHWCHIELPGYRPLDVDLGRRRGDVTFVLVPTHGPSGTWSEEDVPSNE